ncbi:hypothetical protein AVEN_257582-1 [Araneus ventricosus]|uniref:Uncharacterized protein n=1 Tax=Araneus ventricosus TaxID=182803 RepID=A0A4Y2PJC0_ARAVE|nr:hypothetical protein AVEN_250151-1 [Araneus ventricosus]GBN50614.1 hypothetical protein AVEN_257582-1 [Araneus ventricosus]
MTHCLTSLSGVKSSKSVVSESVTEQYFGTDLAILNLGQQDTCAGTPYPNIHTTPAGERSATTYDLTCNRLTYTGLFNGIGLRAWNPPVLKPRPYH